MKLGLLFAAIFTVSASLPVQADQKFDFKFDLKKMMETGSAEQGVSTSSSNTPNRSTNGTASSGAGNTAGASGNKTIKYTCKVVITNLRGPGDNKLVEQTSRSTFGTTDQDLKDLCHRWAKKTAGRGKIVSAEVMSVERPRNWNCSMTWDDGHTNKTVVSAFNEETARKQSMHPLRAKTHEMKKIKCTPAQ